MKDAKGHYVAIFDTTAGLKDRYTRLCEKCLPGLLDDKFTSRIRTARIHEDDGGQCDDCGDEMPGDGL